MKKYLSLFLIIAVIITCFVGCGKEKFNLKAEYPNAKIITLSGNSAKLDDTKIEEFDYTWHCDPSVSHDEVENAPAEYYTGEKPNGQDGNMLEPPKMPEN